MTKKRIIDKYDYVKKSTPDPQVKDVADQFFDAAIHLSPQLGVVIPEIVNSVLAIELYLKSLTSFSVIKDIKDFSGGVRGGKVTSEPSQPVHKLTDIFEELEDSIKNRFEEAYKASTFFIPSANFKDYLSKYNDCFVAVRYVFEDSSVFKNTNINELQELMKLTKELVESLPRQEVMIK